MKKILLFAIAFSLLITLYSCKNPPNALDDSGLAEDTAAQQNAEEMGQGSENTQAGEDPSPNKNEEIELQTDFDEDSDESTPQPGDIVEIVDSMRVNMSVDDMYEKSDIVVVGEFDGVSYTVVPDDTKDENTVGTLFTDQVVSCERVIKGDAQGDIRVRRIGGKTDDRNLSSNDPELQEGKQYLLFLTAGPSVVEGDTENYKIVGGLGIFPIDSDGNLDVSSQDEQDAQRLLEIYSQQ